MSDRDPRKRPPADDSLRLLARLLGVMRAERRWMLAGGLVALVSSVAGIALLAVSGHFITSMALAGVSGAAINYYTPAALIRLLAILRTGGRYVERLASHEATLRILARLRNWLFARLVPLAPAGLGRLRSAELFSRLRADVDALEHAYLGVLVPLAVAVVASLLTLIVALLKLPSLALAWLVLFCVAGVALPWWIVRRSRAPGATTVTSAEHLRALAADGLRGRAELALYGAEAAHAARLQATRDLQQRAQRRVDRLQASGQAWVMLCAQLTAACTLLLGLPAHVAGGISAPDLVMLTLLGLAAYEVVAPLPDAWAQLGATLACARRVFALADSRPPVPEPACPATPPDRSGLRMRGVRMRYAASAPWVLDGLDLDLAPGQRLAVVGASGAGKSSLIGALTRLYPFEGRIELGGLAIESLSGDDVRARIGVVEQQPYLFDASLRDNLRLARPDASDAQLHTVLALAQLDSYVASLAHGLDTWVGENGIRVSGGEARRIAIARTLLADAPILILDEPAEGLDAATTARLYRAIDAAMLGRSVLLITHRLGALRSLVDEVATLQQGRIVERLSTQAYLQRAAANAAPVAAKGI